MKEVKTFIKVVSREVATKLANLGFQYIKDGSMLAFIKTDELIKTLNSEFADTLFVEDNALRF